MNSFTTTFPYIHDALCEKRDEVKLCAQGTRQAGNEPPTHFYECAACTKRIKDEYEARLKVTESK